MKQALLFIVGMWSSIPALAQGNYLEIIGPTDVPENVTAYYTSIYHYYGQQLDVTQGADWSVTPDEYATFDAPGVLRVFEVPGDQMVTVEAVFVVTSGTLDVTIRDAVLWFVDSGAEGAGNGESWNDAFTTLQDALVEANVGTEIRVAQGTYRPDQGLSEQGDRYATFQLNSGVAIYGGYAGLGEPDPDARDVELYETVLSGDIGAPADSDDNSYHVVTANDTNEFAILDGFTITAGRANGDDSATARGAGLVCLSGSPTVRNCAFTGNTADGLEWVPKGGWSPIGKGGGVFIGLGDATLINCTFSNNIANVSGGGMYMIGHGTAALLTNCSFVGNAAPYGGGGLNNRYADLTLIGCVFLGNSSPITHGGGLSNEGDADSTLINCFFLGNYAHWGGGLSNYVHCDATVIGCTFLGNSAGNYGGGVSNAADSNPTLINCLFSGNSAGRHGGAIDNWSVSYPLMVNCTLSGNIADSDDDGFGVGGGVSDQGSSTSTVTNCILWGNSDSGPQDESAQIHSLETDAIINYSCVQGWTGALGGVGNIGDDPLFVDSDGPDDEAGTEDDDLRLQPHSPVVDGGSDSAVPNDVTVDLDGDPRFVDGDCDGDVVVDMGAYEFQADAECCWADLDGGGDVGPADLATLLGSWGPCSPDEDCPADLNADGEVSAFDLAILLGAWGPCEG